MFLYFLKLQYIVYPTLTDYMLKSRSDFKNGKNSPNCEYLTAFDQKIPFKKYIYKKLRALLTN